MSPFSIVIGEILSDLEEPLMSVFYVQIGNECFPDNQWTDLSVSILGFWMNNIIRNYNSLNSEYDLYFMDGPYAIHIKQDNDILSMNTTKLFSKMWNQNESIQITKHELLSAIKDALSDLKILINQDKDCRIKYADSLSTIDSYITTIRFYLSM